MLAIIIIHNRTLDKPLATLSCAILGSQHNWGGNSLNSDDIITYFVGAPRIHVYDQVSFVFFLISTNTICVRYYFAKLNIG